MFYDFKAIKEAVSVEQAMVFLTLKNFTAEKGNYRGECPACRSGSRSLEIFPSTNSFRCHAAKKSGDVISLVAHVHGTSMKDAAGFLDDKRARKAEKTAEPTKEFGPLSHLAHEHKDVQAMGFPEDVAQTLGIGFASRGLMRGFVALPLRDEQGVLTGYVGVPAGTEVKTPPTWHGIHTNVVPIKTKKRA